MGRLGKAQGPELRRVQARVQERDTGQGPELTRELGQARAQDTAQVLVQGPGQARGQEQGTEQALAAV
jgi:hypothetical protein